MNNGKELKDQELRDVNGGLFGSSASNFAMNVKYESSTIKIQAKENLNSVQVICADQIVALKGMMRMGEMWYVTVDNSSSLGVNVPNSISGTKKKYLITCRLESSGEVHKIEIEA